MVTDPLLSEFVADLEQYMKAILGLELASEFCHEPPRELDCKTEDQSRFLKAANAANSALREAQAGMPVLRGAVYAQIISRFEAFIRNEIEDLAVRASTNATSFSQLPRDLRDSLTLFAATVLANPKKYRMEKFVVAIAKVMSRNLDDTSAPGEVNQFCLSITTENIRSGTVDELFRRFGIVDVWARVGASAEVQTLLQQTDPGQASSTCQKRLNTAVERRNQIIHPSSGIIWPSPDEVKDLGHLLTTIGTAIASNIPVFEIKLRGK